MFVHVSMSCSLWEEAFFAPSIFQFFSSVAVVHQLVWMGYGLHYLYNPKDQRLPGFQTNTQPLSLTPAQDGFNLNPNVLWETVLSHTNMTAHNGSQTTLLLSLNFIHCTLARQNLLLSKSAKSFMTAWRVLGAWNTNLWSNEIKINLFGQISKQYV